MRELRTGETALVRYAKAVGDEGGGSIPELMTAMRAAEQRRSEIEAAIGELESTRRRLVRFSQQPIDELIA